MSAALAVLALLVLAAPAQAVPAPRTVLQDDRRLLFSGDAAREAALDDLAGLGADVVRVLVRWRRPLAELDAAVAGLERRGLEPLLVPTGPAPDRHAGCRRADLPPGACRPSPAAYGAFVARVGRRFPRVRRWALWNEPNVGAWLGPQAERGRPVAPGLYRRLVRAGVAGLRRSGHGGDEVLVGETAAVPGVEDERPGLGPTSPRRFLAALLCARCAPLPGTGLGHHPYARGGSRSPFAALPAEAYGPAALGALDRALARAHARGRTRRRLRVHVTEAGVQTAPPDRLLGVPLARHALHLDGLERLAWAHARSVAQYPLVDEPDLGGFQSGLRFADGTPKPALATYATPAWAGCGVVHGRLRTAPRAGVVVALERARGGVTARTRTRARGVVRVRLPAGGGAWRLTWAGGRSRVVRPASDPRPAGARC